MFPSLLRKQTQRWKTSPGFKGWTMKWVLVSDDQSWCLLVVIFSVLTKNKIKQSYGALIMTNQGRRRKKKVKCQVNERLPAKQQQHFIKAAATQIWKTRRRPFQTELIFHFCFIFFYHLCWVNSRLQYMFIFHWFALANMIFFWGGGDFAAASNWCFHQRQMSLKWSNKEKAGVGSGL